MIKATKNGIRTLRERIDKDIVYGNPCIIKMHQTDDDTIHELRIWLGLSADNNRRVWVSHVDGVELKDNVCVCIINSTVSDRALAASLVLAWELTH